MSNLTPIARKDPIPVGAELLFIVDGSDEIYNVKRMVVFNYNQVLFELMDSIFPNPYSIGYDGHPVVETLKQLYDDLPQMEGRNEYPYIGMGALENLATRVAMTYFYYPTGQLSHQELEVLVFQQNEELTEYFPAADFVEWEWIAPRLPGYPWGPNRPAITGS